MACLDAEEYAGEMMSYVNFLQEIHVFNETMRMGRLVIKPPH